MSYSAMTGNLYYTTPFRPSGPKDSAFSGFARRQGPNFEATALHMPGGPFRRLAWLDTASPPRAGVLPDVGG